MTMEVITAVDHSQKLRPNKIKMDYSQLLLTWTDKLNWLLKSEWIFIPPQAHQTE